MAITQAICRTYFRDIQNGVHLPGHEYKAALYRAATAALDADTAAYTAVGELANGNGYTTGGIVLLNRLVDLLGGYGTLDFSDPVWAAANFAAEGMLIYNNTVAGKNAICVLNFGGTITATNAPFTVDLPAQGAGTSLLRIG